MSMEYCHDCGCMIDTDYNVDHDADCLGKEIKEELKRYKRDREDYEKAIRN